MIKHIGRHNNKRVAIMYRQVPDEAHMALVVYTDSLPMSVHDELMRVLESEAGQDAENLADAAYRHIMPDGNNCLVTIHRERYMKKVPTNQVIVTPTTNSSCRLDELNDILNEMAKGEEAVKRLAEIDANAGLRDPNKTSKTSASSVNTNSAPVDGVLSDSDIASQHRTQAAQMRANANALLAEAELLETEANKLAPEANNVTKTRKTRTRKKANETKIEN